MASTNASNGTSGHSAANENTTFENHSAEHQSADDTSANEQTAGATDTHTDSPNPGTTEPVTSTASTTTHASNQDSDQTDTSSSTSSSSSSSSTTVGGQNSTQQSSANTNATTSAPPIPATTPLSPAQSTPSTSTTSTDSSQAENFSVHVGTSTTVTISGLGITRIMSAPTSNANPTGRFGVRFADWTDVQNTDGSTFRQPTNSSPAPFTFTAGNSQQQKSHPAPVPAAAAPPPSGPPPNPPTTPAAAAPEPEPEPPRACSCCVEGATDSDSSAEHTPETPDASAAPPQNQQQTQHPRVVSHIAPPIGARAAAAMGNQRPQPLYFLSSAPAPAQAPAQPYLWVNPPLVSPSIPPPPQGNTGSWCYPSQSPFWAGASAAQTNPPPQFYVAEQAYVAQPAYVATVQQMPQVQYYVNGTTGPFVYYTK
ncbi:uncharacterized protein GGS22DRAFT_199786 [Annulohypoxylon maeteangense]|uniref:uncharacterized protein n=1 Tax=Annulohypoxylon maeteangense TaxID=1927788 RepID=UPI002007555A|nr:uncharacterized protein GGS22DRAFT_199786 [Annulohypoxylon maeteangense]KAI0885483.1 hypothetical protein GGS22DRAFT_199786 [Annulohypoxylon maeteangense]